MIFQFNRKQVFLAIIVVFLSVQLIGLYTGYLYLQYIKTGELKPIFENPNDVSNSFLLLFYILLMTGVILLIIRFKKALLRVLEAVAIFFTSDIVFELMIPYGIGIIPIGAVLAFLLTVWKIFRPTLLSQDVALVFSVAGAGAVIGVSFGILPVIAFILLLSTYDFISVFYTKHMVYMAKAITERPIAFTAAFPVKDRIEEKGKNKEFQHVFQLGGGDLVIPLVFSVAVLNAHGFVPMLTSLIGSLIALIILFYYVLNKPGIALPALPPISAGALIGFAIGLLL